MVPPDTPPNKECRIRLPPDGVRVETCAPNLLERRLEEEEYGDGAPDAVSPFVR